MGLNLKDLVVREKTTLESFASRIIAIDAYNALYQFLATIRGYDGAQLADSQGAVTSHLSGSLIMFHFLQEHQSCNLCDVLEYDSSRCFIINV